MKTPRAMEQAHTRPDGKRKRAGCAEPARSTSPFGLTHAGARLLGSTTLDHFNLHALEQEHNSPTRSSGPFHPSPPAFGRKHAAVLLFVGMKQPAGGKHTMANKTESLESKDWREGMGIFGTPEELEAAALTTPTAALEMVLGTKLGVPREVREDDAQSLENRKAAFGNA